MVVANPLMDTNPHNLPFPNQCVCCGSRLVFDLPHLTCVNPLCSEKLVGILADAGDRSNLDITNLGDQLCRALVISGLVTNLAELFTLEPTRLSQMPLGKQAYGTVRATKLLDAIQKASTKPWNIVLHSLGCPQLGQPVCDQLAHRYSLSDLINTMHPVALKQELPSIDGVGETTANTFVDWLQINRTWLSKIISDNKLQTSIIQEEDTPKPLLGMSIVLTGGFSTKQARSEYEKRIKAAGGKVPGSVSKSTTYLVVGNAPGADKTEAALKNGVKQIDEQTLLAFFAENGI